MQRFEIELVIVEVVYNLSDEPFNREGCALEEGLFIVLDRRVIINSLSICVEPVEGDHINCLATVKPVREPSMIGLREGEDKLARELLRPVDGDTVLDRNGRGKHQVQVEQDVWLLREDIRECFLVHLFKFVFVRWRNAIPSLSRTHM